MSIKRMAHYKDPKIELQVESLRRAASDQALKEHSARNGGTHGLGPGHVFESTQGAQNKADSALSSAKDYTDTALQGVAYISAGDTDSRPEEPPTGFMYFDTDLGIPVWFDGSNWVDATGGDPDE